MDKPSLALAGWGAFSTLLNLGLGWWAIKLTRDKAIAERPWITPDPLRQGGRPLLTGPTASLWKIEKIKIQKPGKAMFYLHEPIMEGGSIVEPRAVPAGRVLSGDGNYFTVASPSWPVELRIRIALRTDPRRTSSLTVRVSA